jgi:hypothetical protein
MKTAYRNLSTALTKAGIEHLMDYDMEMLLIDDKGRYQIHLHEDDPNFVVISFQGFAKIGGVTESHIQQLAARVSRQSVGVKFSMMVHDISAAIELFMDDICDYPAIHSEVLFALREGVSLFRGALLATG